MRTQSTLGSCAVVLVLISPVVLALWIVATSVVVDGKIVDKHESIEMPLEDAWRHVFAVTYEYQPSGSPFPMRASHPIVYPISDPRAGQLAGGTRRYGNEAFVYLVEATFGLGAAVAAVLFALFWITDKISQSPLFRVVISEEGRNALAAGLQSKDGLPEQVRKLARLARARERPSKRDD